MGKIFTKEEVRVRAMPAESDFYKLADLVRKKLTANPAILGGCINGSVLCGKPSLRSDLDVLVVFRSDQESSVYPFLDELSAYADRKFVPLEFVTASDRLAGSCFHTIGPCFRQHLELAQRKGGTIKSDPLNYFNLEHITPEMEYWGYLRDKGRIFTKSFPKISSLSEEKQCHLIQKSLELPIHLARKKLWYNGVRIETDSKEEVVDRFKKHFPPEHSRPLEFLTRLDHSYSSELNHHLVAWQPAEYHELQKKLAIEAARLSWQFLQLVGFNWD